MAHFPENDFIPDINRCFDAISACFTAWSVVMASAKVTHVDGTTENVFGGGEILLMQAAVETADDVIADFLKKYRAYPVTGMPMPGDELNHPPTEPSNLATIGMPCMLWDLKPGSPD